MRRAALIAIAAAAGLLAAAPALATAMGDHAASPRLPAGSSLIGCLTAPSPDDGLGGLPFGVSVDEARNELVEIRWMEQAQRSRTIGAPEGWRRLQLTGRRDGEAGQLQT